MDADNPIVRLCIAAHYVARHQPTAHDTGGLVGALPKVAVAWVPPSLER